MPEGNGGGARELTAVEQEERAKRCYAIEQDIKVDLTKGREALWHLAADLYKFHEETAYSALGYDTLEEWLAQPEIGMTRVAFFRMVRAHRVLVLNHKVDMKDLLLLETSKLDIVMPAIEGETLPLEDVLSDVKNLAASDLRTKYLGAKDKSVPDGAQNGDGKETINGTATDVEPEPDVPPQVLHAGGMVDSWLELGGDRRKAMRNWVKFTKTHPFFLSVVQITKLLEGDEDAPSREEARAAWLDIVSTLGLKFEE